MHRPDGPVTMMRVVVVQDCHDGRRSTPAADSLQESAELNATRLLHREAESALSPLGFRRRVPGLFTRELGPDRQGWIGLNMASHKVVPGTRELWPIVGLRDDEIERTVAELAGYPDHGYAPPTVSCPLRYLIPEDQRPDLSAWTWQVGRPDVLAGIATHLEQSGVPFMKHHCSRSALVEALERGEFGGPASQQAEYRLPVGWMLLGEEARARRALAAILASHQARTDGAAEDFRRFALRLEEQLEAGA